METSIAGPLLCLINQRVCGWRVAWVDPRRLVGLGATPRDGWRCGPRLGSTDAHGELTNELLGYVEGTDPKLLDDLFAKPREHRIDNARARLADQPSLTAKVAELTRILDEDGYLATSQRVAPGLYLIIEHNCAIWAVAQRYGQAGTSELEFIRAVLPEASGERTQHMAAGARRCAYEVREIAA